MKTITALIYTALVAVAIANPVNTGQQDNGLISGSDDGLIEKIGQNIQNLIKQFTGELKEDNALVKELTGKTIEDLPANYDKTFNTTKKIDGKNVRMVVHIIKKNSNIVVGKMITDN
ncbi:uncharacterized protein LOC141906045 [Tubulanus polymorphus]|uniref:uncharacterized protein LOC141906045 n=1 Tax=Tubulanus polymorphus TaxID=672921 RepID=UPI003DA5179F